MMMLLRNPRSVLLARFCSATAAQNLDPQTPHFSAADYLVTSFGLSPEKASRISKPIAYLKSPEKPDAVRRFLSHEGFTEPDIKTIVTSVPTLLCSQEGSVKNNLIALRDLGLSTCALTQIIISQPQILQLRSAATRINFWMDFFGGDEAALLKAFKYNRSLIGQDINKTIAPKLSLLKSHGLTTPDVRRIMLSARRFITYRTYLMEDVLNRTKELGFQPDSKMFVYGLRAMLGCSKDLLQKKMELLKSCGWSEDEFHSALRITPSVAWTSESTLRVKMHFLTGEAGCEPSYIASRPILLKFSLEKRLKPRHQVLQLLKSNGLSGKHCSLYRAVSVTDNEFLKRYVLPHREAIPGVHEAYLAAINTITNLES